MDIFEKWAVLNSQADALFWSKRRVSCMTNVPFWSDTKTSSMAIQPFWTEGQMGITTNELRDHSDVGQSLEMGTCVWFANYTVIWHELFNMNWYLSIKVFTTCMSGIRHEMCHNSLITGIATQWMASMAVWSSVFYNPTTDILWCETLRGI